MIGQTQEGNSIGEKKKRRTKECRLTRSHCFETFARRKFWDEYNHPVRAGDWWTAERTVGERERESAITRDGIRSKGSRICFGQIV